MLSRGAKSVSIAVLSRQAHAPARSDSAIDADFVGFECPDLFRSPVGYGMDVAHALPRAALCRRWSRETPDGDNSLLSRTMIRCACSPSGRFRPMDMPSRSRADGDEGLDRVASAAKPYDLVLSGPSACRSWTGIEDGTSHELRSVPERRSFS